MDDQQMWDAAAATFDQEPDHGLLDPAVRAAWSAMLLPLMPAAPADVVDLGCGTGSLSVLLAEAGYEVRGLDLSHRMVALARAKGAAAEMKASFEQGDAAHPPYLPGSCDAVLVRHVLWAMPNPDAALATWTALLRPAGRLILIEGRWSTDAGLTAADCRTLVQKHREEALVRELSDPMLWGKTITDERYVLLSRE